MPLLEVEGLQAGYGPVLAVRGVTFHLGKGEVLAVVGANGAGKTTLTLAIVGALPLSGGSVRFEGRPLLGQQPEDIARSGIALVPEGRRIFEGLTVAENLMLGQTTSPLGRAEAARRIEAVYAMFPILLERRASLGTRLSGGEQQQLAIARALLSEPRLLVLDEPSLGLAPMMIERVYAVLKTLKGEGLAMLLVEQNPARVGEIADNIVVMANGLVRMTGPASQLLADPDLASAYLSSERQGAA